MFNMADVFEFNESDSENIVNNGNPSESNRFSQSSFDGLEANIYRSVIYEFIAGYRSGSKLLYAIDEQNLYSFNTISKIGQSYLCIEKGCNVRVYIVKDEKCIQQNRNCEHSHANKKKMYDELQCLNEIKEKCSQLNYLLSGQKITVRDIYNSVAQR